MAGFTTAEAVRLRFHLHDTGLAPEALVAQAIDEAHARVLARIDPAVDTADPPAAVILGETLIAGGRVLESLAYKSANGQRVVLVGGQRVDPGQEFAALLAAADRAERHGWETLGPHLWPIAPGAPATATPTIPVLGP